jgi:hypothetical protein
VIRDARLRLDAQRVDAAANIRTTILQDDEEIIETFGKFGLRVTSTEGATVEIPVTYSIRVPRPLLVVRPGSLVAGMVRGRQTAVGFDIVNLGAVATEPLVLSLPDFAWVAVAGENPIPAIPPGGTNHVTLLLTPPADLELGAYAGAMALNAYGYRRVTTDVDLLIAADLENEAKVFRALEILPDRAVLKLKPGEVHEYTVVRVADEITVDLMQSASGIDFSAARNEIIYLEVQGVKIPFASAKLLWRMKKNTHREKDVIDLLFLRQHYPEATRDA